MTDTFTWKAHNTLSGGGEFMEAEAKLGDGYVQSVALGLNPDVQKWSITVSGFKTEVQAALDFIRAHAGSPFYWTPPLGVKGLYKCKTYKPDASEGAGYYKLNLEFEQSYSP